MQEMNFPNGEDKLRALAEQFEVPFEERYWTDMQARLPQKSKKWYLAKPFWLSVLGLGLMAGAALMFYTSYQAKTIDTKLDAVPTQVKDVAKDKQAQVLANTSTTSSQNTASTAQYPATPSGNSPGTTVQLQRPALLKNLLPSNPGPAEVIPTLPTTPEPSVVPSEATEPQALPRANWMIEAIESMKTPYVAPQPMAQIQPIQHNTRAKKGRFNWGIVAGVGYGYNSVSYLEPQKTENSYDMAEESIEAEVNTTSLHLSLGLRAGYKLSKKLSLGAEVLYKARPGLLISMETATMNTERENGYRVNSTVTNTTISDLHLVELPLYADLKLKRHHLIAGIKPAFVVKAQSPYSHEARISKYDMTSGGMPGNNSIISVNSSYIANLPTGQIFRPGLGLIGGYQFDISKQLSLAVRYSLGLFPMTKLEQTYKSLYAFNNSDFQLSLGYNF